jgi:hypothetical protein
MMEQYIKRLTEISKQLRDILDQVSANKNNPQIMNGLKTKTQSLTNELTAICNQLKSKIKVAGESYDSSQEAVGELVENAAKTVVPKKVSNLKKFGDFVGNKLNSAIKHALWLVESPLRGLYHVTKWTFISGVLIILGAIIGKTYIQSKRDSEAKRAYDGTGGLESFEEERLSIYDSPAYEYFLQTV